ncbi:MAG: ParB/RepB/Spo0J family partition protein [Nitrospira sp.]|mgnify:CR=1 FL=1|nr:MAG: ParB/RepB/Spo0J family partition protein [Nitrospira sp.]
MEKKALGRGLEALLPKGNTFTARPSPTGGEDVGQDIPVHQIRPNRFQPREDFSEDSLAQLTDSLRQNGMLQPVVVRRMGDGGYELVAGERRFRAAELAGWQRVPAIVRNCSDEEAMVLALEENLQRSDLNPMETARAYHRLMNEFGLTQDTMAKRLGRDRSTVANILRLVQLAHEVQRWVEAGTLSAGHAKVLLGCAKDDQVALARQIVDGQLSVRQAERLAGRAGKRSRPTRQAINTSIYVSIEERLRRQLGTRVSITRGRKAGKIVVHFFSAEDLDRLVEMMLA